MAICDVREFIGALEKTGDLVRIKEEVDWDEEAGAIFRRGCEIQAPAILLEKIRDYPGHRMLGNPLATFRRVAIALGLAPETPTQEIIEEVSRRFEKPIKPILVDKAPCQENVIMGDEVDLNAFPAPMIHDGDGGRYIGTWTIMITKDIDTGWVNWGMYRGMNHNEKYLGTVIIPGTDVGRIFYGKYVPRSQPMPFARVIGADIISGMVSCMPVGIEVDEADIAGGLMGKPMPLVKCKTVDLEVPANSEVVLEGEIRPDALVDEGPFGEFTGFRVTPRAPTTLAKVNCITYRNDPIHLVSNPGVPVDESAVCMTGIGSSRMLAKFLKEQGFPIRGVYYPPECSGPLVVVSTETILSNTAYQIGMAVLGSRRGVGIQHVIVVGPDVDPYNMQQVMHALATQCHPQRGITVVPKTSIPFIPCLSLEERLWFKGAGVIYDCTFPVNWKKGVEIPIRASFEAIYRKETQDKALKLLAKHGI